MQKNNNSSYNFWARYTKTLEGVIFGIYMQFTFKWDQPMLCLNNGFIFWKFFDAASSTHHKKTCPTLGKGKFRFFGPLIPVLTQNEIKTHMLLRSRSPLKSWLGHWTTKIREIFFQLFFGITVRVILIYIVQKKNVFTTEAVVHWYALQIRCS